MKKPGFRTGPPVQSENFDFIIINNIAIIIIKNAYAVLWEEGRQEKNFWVSILYWTNGPL